MPYDLYWKGSIDAFWIYKKKAEIEAEREKDKINNTEWLNGFYTLFALKDTVCAMMGKDTFQYPKAPIGPKKSPPKAVLNKQKEISERIREHNLLIKAGLEEKRCSKN